MASVFFRMFQCAGCFPCTAYVKMCSSELQEREIFLGAHSVNECLQQFCAVFKIVQVNHFNARVGISGRNGDHSGRNSAIVLYA